LNLGSELFFNSQQLWLGDELIKGLADLLIELIALEILQDITSCLHSHVMQIELVLVTALTTAGCEGDCDAKLIQYKAQSLNWLGISSVAQAEAY